MDNKGLLKVNIEKTKLIIDEKSKCSCSACQKGVSKISQVARVSE